MKALVLAESSPVRLTVINSITCSNYISTTASAMVDHLYERMKNGLVRFCYLKKDGSLSEAFGTLKSDLVQKNVNGSGYLRTYNIMFCLLGL